ILTCVNMVPLVGYISVGVKWGKKLSGVADDITDWAKSKWPWGKKPKPNLPPCLNSFPGGTRVLMGDGTNRPIETIRPGDQVAAADPTTGESGPRTVAAVIYTSDDRDYTELIITAADGTQSAVTATDHHPFWVPTLGQWTDAADIRPGDTLRTDTGTAVLVASVRHWTALAPAYNLAVADLHTYHVLAGDTPLLTHNCPKQIEEAFAGLDKRTNSNGRTQGTVFFSDGKGGLEKFAEKINSGHSESRSAAITQFLAQSGMPTGLPVHPAAAHLETRLAWLMSNSADPKFNKMEIVINNADGVCPNQCPITVPKILYDDQEIVVWYKDSNGNTTKAPTLKGTRPRGKR
ncbi:polymorphic toxin-type HINT domain-containing protein, partial [Kitasatospora sp. NPDC008115]|uniref:polymorphic toxin-type HINT domain-containing protein n=1 Tax=Kitasatospora sp. NPDC008115 TaxID=3364022 RepID=UPI0036E50F9B